MHIYEYICINITYWLMHVDANIHMYIWCLLQLTYMHRSVMYVLLSIYIHMYTHTCEHYSHKEKADKKSIWLSLSGKVMKMRENIKIFLIKETLLKSNQVNTEMCFRILYYSLYTDDHCMKLFLCEPLK